VLFENDYHTTPDVRILPQDFRLPDGSTQRDIFLPLQNLVDSFPNLIEEQTQWYARKRALYLLKEFEKESFYDRTYKPPPLEKASPWFKTPPNQLNVQAVRQNAQSQLRGEEKTTKRGGKKTQHRLKSQTQKKSNRASELLPVLACSISTCRKEKVSQRTRISHLLLGRLILGRRQWRVLSFLGGGNRERWSSKKRKSASI